ncbi:MAG: plasmid recombination protein, partial [Verrucomicrobia bacterium]|nr:plasmid recombination protein [Verrucomicrobiota bacterium]
MSKNYQVVHIEKLKAGDLAGIEKENNRTEKIDLPNKEIDWSKTPKNVSIVKSIGFRNTIQGMIADHGIVKTIRKDATYAIDGMYSASPEFFKGKSKDEIIAYFTECVEFHRKHFGEIINAVIHFDEKTPHLHVIAVPFVERADGSFSLSAKDKIGGRSQLARLQTMFNEEVGERWDLDRGEKNNDVKHLTNTEFKTLMRQKEAEAAKLEKQQALEKAAEAEQYKHELEKQAVKLEEKIGKLERISEIIESLKFKVSDLFKEVNEAISGFVNILRHKIEHKDKLSPGLIMKAMCRMFLHEERDGKKVLYPGAIDGSPLTWNSGIKPLYTIDGDHFIPQGAVSDKAVYSLDEWDRLFVSYNRDPFNPLETPKAEIDQDINDIDRIAAGKKEPQYIDQLCEPDEIEVFWDGEKYV